MVELFYLHFVFQIVLHYKCDSVIRKSDPQLHSELKNNNLNIGLFKYVMSKRWRHKEGNKEISIWAGLLFYSTVIYYTYPFVFIVYVIFKLN